MADNRRNCLVEYEYGERTIRVFYALLNAFIAHFGDEHDATHSQIENFYVKVNIRA